MAEVLVITSEVGNLGVVATMAEVDHALRGYFDRQEAEARVEHERDASWSTYRDPIIERDGDDWSIRATCCEEPDAEPSFWQTGSVEHWTVALPGDE